MMSGTTVHLSRLLAKKHFAKKLTFTAKSRYTHGMGSHLSKSRGQGMVFEEVREYLTSDDPRRIDWRVTARTGRPHTRVYAEERIRPTLVLVDYRQSMHFGTQVGFKYVLAAEIAAVLSWLAFFNKDPIGLIIYNESHYIQVPVRMQSSLISRLFYHLEQPCWQQKLPAEGLLGVCDILKQSLRHHDVYLLSDCYDFESAHAQFAPFTLQNSVALIWLSDQLERSLPAAGVYGFTDGQTTCCVNTFDEALRKEYEARFAAKLAQLRQWCHTHQATLMPFYTEVALEKQLSSYLRKNSYDRS